jgi:two-component system, chemotaxis family, CheB/CheR fusion protein
MNLRAGEPDAPHEITLSADDRALALLAAIVESSDDAIISKNLDGIITTWNTAATRLFGYQADEIVGQGVLKLLPPELRHEEADILRRLRAGQKVDHYETRRQHKDGTAVDVSLTISPIRDAKGRVIGASSIARDISDRKRAEAALIQTEKLAAVGRMAAAIAHEVNNPLEAVTNLAYLLTTHPSLDDEAREYARLLLDEVGRASRITKQTLAYYRDSSTPAPVDLPELMDSVLQLHQPVMMKRNIHVRRIYRVQRASLAGFAAELRQVFANLILNAVDASPDGGQLQIKLSTVARNGGEVHVTVADNGCGIPPPRRARLFEPFFTTKTGRGNGLGLWVSNGIVRKHGGRIRLRTSVRPGHSGSVFTVILPCSTKQGAASKAA